MAISSLPLYPYLTARKSLHPSQIATLNSTIAHALLQTLELPAAKRDTIPTRNFVASYVKDAAQQTLNTLIYRTKNTLSKSEQLIRTRTLQLAEKLAASETAPFQIESLVDLSIVYAPTNLSRVRGVWDKACSSPNLLGNISSEAVPSFTTVLSPDRIQNAALFGTRKTAQVLACVIRSLPSHAISLFARDKSFVLALARTYGEGLTTIATNYGGLQAFASSATSGAAGDWELWVETKVALLDTFHALLRALLDDVAPATGPGLAVAADRVFDVIFALLEVDSPSHTSTISDTPFLNCSLIADYQHAYDLGSTLKASLRKADDARMDLLDFQLQSLNMGEGASNRDPGALNILLRSSGVAPGIDYKGKGKAVQVAEPELPHPVGSSSNATHADPDVDEKVAQVLTVLPDHPPEYIRALLVHPDYAFHGNAAKVINALLEGSAPLFEDLQPAAVTPVPSHTNSIHHAQPQDTSWEFTRNRINVFDNEALEPSNARYGKKADNSATFMSTPAYSEEERAEILRRAQDALVESDEESVDFGIDVVGSGMGLDNLTGTTKGKARDLAFEDELDLDGAVGVVGGGSDGSGDEDDEDEGAERVEGWSGAGGEGTPAKVDPELICELAYIEDASVFERDGQTKRGKARADLRSRTGWSDDQIEGWKIMLERDPKRKEKMLRKHQFSGNKPLATTADNDSSHPAQNTRGRGGSHGGRGRGRGGGGGRGRGGGGRGGGGGGGGGEGGDKRDRAWKDKRGNQARKRGHDKKMAKAGAGPSS